MWIMISTFDKNYYYYYYYYYSVTILLRIYRYILKTVSPRSIFQTYLQTFFQVLQVTTIKTINYCKNVLRKAFIG